MSITEDRDALHRLIGELQVKEVRTAERVLQALNASSDCLVTALRNAPVDDEAETDAEREATERAREDVREGDTFRMKTSGESCGACEVADPLESGLLNQSNAGGYTSYHRHLPCSHLRASCYL